MTATTTHRRDTFGKMFSLSPAACAVLKTPNAGGDSVVSESASVEVLSRALFCSERGGVELLATEMEVRYAPSGGAMTDYLLRWRSGKGGDDGTPVSVSATRVFDAADASRVIEKKLRGVVYARQSLFAPVCGEECAWVLHVFVADGSVAKAVRAAWRKTERSLRCGVVVVVTVWREQMLYERTR
ncbi:hypothetical protein HDU83_007106 [Entophlyctis luteolus]|nr:hypothetical protein HDU83_007106 [Entophlyctis luteolus]